MFGYLGWSQLQNVTAQTTDSTSETRVTRPGVTGLWIMLNVTAGTALDLTVQIVAVGPFNGAEVWGENTTAVTGIGRGSIIVSPGAVGASTNPGQTNAALVATGIIPPIWRARIEHGNTNPADYVVHYIYEMAGGN